MSPDSENRRNRFDPIGFAAGLAFVGAGTVALTMDSEDVDGAMWWLIPLVVLAVGIGLVLSVRRPADESFVQGSEGELPDGPHAEA